ncbi:reverse transcriptase domain-containing protein [uncultured Bacteroides sp.]|uniref:reverse transcriptase domain-containing protein n=1 Tax=uncultured Bacteroides sp. TaxID=162156 RepID=UPI002594EA37|nr:reverse transcriptase domain-containing protein [uncultured Bacteroides sp.]
MDNENQMTVIRDAWPQICSFGWLLCANTNARRGKRDRSEVMAFTAHLEDNLFAIQDAMIHKTYILGPYRKLWVYVPKSRLVMALPYPDRIVQWSIYQYLNPFYERLFIEDSYACRKNKGSHKAANRLQYWMRKVSRKPGPGWYYLKLDISKYFYRVNHEKLLEILSRRIKDADMMEVIRGIVDSRAEPFGLPPGRTPQNTPPEEWVYDAGMPIGNLTSQLFANIYLNELDQYCKHQLKIHYYIRYMDDIIILAPDKAMLHEWKGLIEVFLRDELKLSLNDKTSIRPVRQGVEFVGVRIWATHKKLRKSTVRRIKRETRAICERYAADMDAAKFSRHIASIKGLLEHTESISLKIRLNNIYKTVMENAGYAVTDEPFGHFEKEARTNGKAT